ncbi:M23 family metallopeptidase [Lysinibacter sp. HNR]|uniref:M23 family metallopeptidase n=1 Tax=Lysinibacter sp. HNR TaxID=3031408 RepID=UPI0024355455|nr:M23 family metallopeptidase [Lysinibacter sp. HNR]WGD36819.1 M23 family metallopeptidase [Lysinibacter sp. HNR]
MKRTIKKTLTKRKLVRGSVTTLLVGGLVGATLTVGGVGSASAAELPTWNDVQSAKANEASAAAKVTEIEGLIRTLQGEVAATKAEAERTALILEEAEAKFQDADARYNSLIEQAAESQERASSAASQASSIASQMYRSSGGDQTLQLFLDQDAAGVDALLSKLSMMTQATDRNNTIYNEAQVATNNAKSLGDQAETAKVEREELRAEAEEALKVAAQAAQNAQEQLVTQESQEETLRAQLAALKDTTQTTVAGYQQRLAEEAAARAAALEAERQARLAAQQQRPQPPSGGGGGGGGSVGGGGAPGSIIGDWVRPSDGRFTSGFGGRGQVCGNGICTGGAAHTGVDLAGAQGSRIYAASAGKVSLAGSFYSYGNMIEIDHGGGIKTRYGHIMDGGIYVRTGQNVSAGEVIAGVGSTGLSTGPHLHFEFYQNGSPIDPEPPMRARGITFR